MKISPALFLALVLLAAPLAAFAQTPPPPVDLSHVAPPPEPAPTKPLPSTPLPTVKHNLSGGEIAPAATVPPSAATSTAAKAAPHAASTLYLVLGLIVVIGLALIIYAVAHRRQRLV